MRHNNGPWRKDSAVRCAVIWAREKLTGGAGRGYGGGYNNVGQNGNSSFSDVRSYIMAGRIADAEYGLALRASARSYRCVYLIFLHMFTLRMTVVLTLAAHSAAQSAAR